MAVPARDLWAKIQKELSGKTQPEQIAIVQDYLDDWPDEWKGPYQELKDRLVKLMKEIPHYARTPGGTFRGWLSRLTANVCHDFRRRKATRALPPADGLSGAGEHVSAEFEEVEYRKSLVDSGLAIRDRRRSGAAPPWRHPSASGIPKQRR